MNLNKLEWKLWWTHSLPQVLIWNIKQDLLVLKSFSSCDYYPLETLICEHRQSIKMRQNAVNYPHILYNHGNLLENCSFPPVSLIVYNIHHLRYSSKYVAGIIKGNWKEKEEDDDDDEEEEGLTSDMDTISCTYIKYSESDTIHAKWNSLGYLTNQWFGCASKLLEISHNKNISFLRWEQKLELEHHHPIANVQFCNTSEERVELGTVEQNTTAQELRNLALSFQILCCNFMVSNYSKC